MIKPVGVATMPPMIVNSSCPPCPLCQKTFLARRSLLRHLRNVHERNDHKELVPSNKAGHDANRIRNKLGRFVKVGEDVNARIITRADESCSEASTPSVTPNAVANTTMKPPKKRLAHASGMTMPELKRPAVMSQPMLALSQPLSQQNILMMQAQLSNSTSNLLGTAMLKPTLMQMPGLGNTNFVMSHMMNQAYQATANGFPMVMVQPVMQTMRPSLNYLQPMAPLQQMNQLRTVY